MPRLTAIEPATAEGKAKALLDGAQKALGATPNLIRTLANAPAALQAYLGFGQALAGGGLSAQTREAIALAVAGANGCDYCASAHSAIGRRLGLDDAELARNLRGGSADADRDAALRFARAVVEKRGSVSDDDLRQIRAAGHGDGAITEIVAAVAFNTFSNYFDHVAKPEVDFPFIPASGKRAA